MAKTLVGLYDHLHQARDTVQDLVDAGFDRNGINLVANASAEEYSRYFDDEGRYRADAYDADATADPAYRDERAHRDDLTPGEGAAAGAGIGATVGGLGGLLMGLGLLAIPGVGPALAAGPIVSALVGAGIGAAAGGLMGALVNSGVPEEEAGYYAEGVRRGGSLVSLTVEDDRVAEAERIMNRHDPVDLDERVSTWRESGFERYDAEADPYSAEQIASERQTYGATLGGTVAGSQAGAELRDREDVQVELRDREETVRDGDTRAIPVVEEEVAVGKRQVNRGGVRVRSYVRETPVEEQVTLRDEEIRVERRPVNRELADADAAFREETIELTETDEEAVVEKRARVKEEVLVGKEVHEHTETVRDTVRSTEVEVERLGAEAYERNREDFREHYGKTFGGRGSYEDYEPAYRYGSDMAVQGESDWNTLEPEARQRWEDEARGDWDEYRDAVRYGYERNRDRA
jgi:uncharacterized protein (TIGR02271 family)